MIATLLAALALPAAAAPRSFEEGPAELARRFNASWQLPENRGLYERWDPNRSWANPHVISTIQIVSERMALELPLADPLMIGDISRKGGGFMPGHSTHQMGIDVDIGLFMDYGRQPLGGFVEVPPNHLDVYATWILIRSLFDTGQVQHILLDQSLINRLRDYVLHEVGLDPRTVDSMFPPPTRRLSWSVRNVIRHAPKHKDHLHVRLVPPESARDEPMAPGNCDRGAFVGPITPAWF